MLLFTIGILTYALNKIKRVKWISIFRTSGKFFILYIVGISARAFIFIENLLHMATKIKSMKSEMFDWSVVLEGRFHQSESYRSFNPIVMVMVKYLEGSHYHHWVHPGPSFSIIISKFWKRIRYVEYYNK